MRRLFTILSALSLVLCVLVVGLWITSSTRPRSLSYRKGPVIWNIASERAGRVMAGYVITSAADECPDGWRSDSVDLPIDPKAIRIPKLEWQVLGFSLKYFDIRGGTNDYVFRLVSVPYWFLTVLMAVLPVWWTRRAIGRWQRTRRLAAGLCLTCGYDLRASPDRCPERGTVVPTKTVA